MSYFGTALDTLIKRKKIAAVELARISGVSAPMISRYRRGAKGGQVWVSPDDLERLLEAITSDANERAELLRAHLMDECHGPGSELVDIVIVGGGRIAEAAPAYHAKLPDEAEKHFATIRRWYIKDADVRNIVDGLGEFLGGVEASAQRGSSSSPPGKFPGADVKVPPQRYGSKKKSPPNK